jgi:hypothetical protein
MASRLVSFPPFPKSLNMKDSILCLPYAFMLVSCSAYSTTMKMEAACSTETSLNFQQTTRRYIPEDRILHNHRCEHLKSYQTGHVFPRYLLVYREERGNRILRNVGE